MKTIYSRLILVSLSVLIVGMIMLTVGLNIVFKNYIVNQNHQEMLRLAQNFNQLIDNQVSLGVIDAKTIRDELYRLERYANLKIWMIPSGDENVIMADENTDINLIYSELDQLEIDRVLESGQPIFRSANYKTLSGNQYYTLIFPVTVKDKELFVLYLNKSVPFVNNTVKEINRFALITLFLASLYAATTIFFSAKSVSNDIKRLNNGVKFVSKGNFEYEFNTDRKDEIGELTKNFNQMTKELKSVEESRRKFISDLSHDLRSPITSIKGYTQGILDGTIPAEKWEKYLNIVSEETDRLTKLINDILDLSKMQTGELHLNKVDFDAHELLLNVLDRFEERIEKKSVEVSLKLAEGNTMVEGDSQLIERVVYNLVDNAVKFINEDGLLEVLTDIKENKMLIGVRNTGPLIPDDKLANIWQRFSKLDNSRGIEKKSSGLGLSIVKEILDAHGEKIDVYSNEYLGVMFVFSLSRSAFSNNGKNS
ncbi:MULTISPECIES: cell wall metabolism sensor histidine kinase WalK [unclassified Fusibacter]|uniref:sensor histidine kinase n=1 Tax=unclassified Fusibacter TaxID=2624464 RepID=UPI001013809F|nr:MULTISPECIES: HAMP domain-containing sensor histidine kinase [unclassified Fusibacter]MCK8059647.1 HAMP domain-containing histidine kinase [Fusibacter sp. A2]NPE21448.1 HAMP domain-containing histidine kinase [Fusibacter sp. A1]RXV61859.1 sensor histidine kinase [Fusibacter sp. A1]